MRARGKTIRYDINYLEIFKGASEEEIKKKVPKEYWKELLGEKEYGNK
jgi:hypothetical protein